MTRLRVSQAAGVAVVAMEVLTLAGLMAGLPGIATWGAAGLPAVTPVAAVLLAISGFLLTSARRRDVAVALGLGIAATAATGLLIRALDVDEPSQPLVAATATALCLLGLGLAFAFAGFARYRLVTVALAVVVGTVAAFALLGYLSGIDTLYNVFAMGSPPLPVAVALLTIALAILLRASADPALHQPRPLWHLLAALGAAIALPLMLFGAYAGARMADAEFNQVQQQLVEEARSLSAGVDREVIAEIETLHALAGSPSLQHHDFDAFQHQAEAPLELRRNGNIMLIDRNLQRIVDTSVPFGTPMPTADNIADAVRRAFATGSPQVTSLFRGPLSGEMMFAIVLPVTIDGETRYALARAPSQLALERVVDTNALLSGHRAVVFDDFDRVLAMSRPEAGATSPRAPQSGAASGILDFTDDTGRPSLQAFTRSETTGWSSAVAASYAVLGAPLVPLWRTLGAMALFSISVVLGFALWVGRIIARSVGHAAHTAVAVGEGRPLPVSGTPIAEVNTLMAELRTTAGKHAAAEGSLRDSERQLQLALSAAELGTWQYHPRRHLASGGHRARELFGIAADEAPCAQVLARVHGDDRDRLVAALEASLAGGGSGRGGAEFRLKEAGGRVRWLEMVWLARGQANVVGTVADVTARKEIEEERHARAEKEHLLMREMNHRAKNMLSVVDAIAHQTATSNPHDFVKRFSARIRSLSANQDLLFRSEWRGVEISALVHAQLAHFADLIPRRIAVAGPRLRLTSASAQAIGLALHELATNAGKYGALSTESGRVDIRWEVAGAFTMSWTESGGPTVSPPQRQGFGSVVMERMVERSVGGTVKLDYAPAGLTWQLSCPAANVLEDKGAYEAEPGVPSEVGPPPAHAAAAGAPAGPGGVTA